MSSSNGWVSVDSIPPRFDYDELRRAIRSMTRKQQLYKVLKAELSAQGYWKNRPRGKPNKNINK